MKVKGWSRDMVKVRGWSRDMVKVRVGVDIK